MRRTHMLGGIAALALFCFASIALAHAPSGAIFTTLSDGSEVNFNQFPNKEAVYLDGGPGPGAPQTAAGLDDGTYVFQVTDPSGKTLLSTDAAKFRRFTVSNGVITAIVPPGHVIGADVDHPPAITVQLMPYKDTPNPGGVYKVWVTTVEDYLLGCSKLGVANGLDVVDPGNGQGVKHGFIPAHSKTDNFKVKKVPIIEIDCRFIDANTGEQVLGPGITWTDTCGASNKKYAYEAPELLVLREAHVEAVETGVHKITIEDGPNYKIKNIRKPDGTFLFSPGTVDVRIQSDKKELTVVIKVEIEYTH